MHRQFETGEDRRKMTSSTLSIVESIRSAVKPSDLCCRKASTPVLYASKICPLITTSAATADGPREALLQWQLKSTTNRSIWVYGRPTCNKLCAPSHDASTVVLSISSTVDEFCWQHDRLAMARFSKSEVWDKISEGRNAKAAQFAQPFRPNFDL